ncbi:MAG: SDR family NAD(P)-dependent oxidoreductase [Candidatus Limnocylindria bacterium]
MTERRTDNGQVVVITGASAGIGRALAQLYGRRGARVALLARGTDGLEGARRDVEAAGGRPLPISLDVADAEAVDAAAEQIERDLGPIDVWINNAMVSIFSPIRETAPDEFRRVTDVTYHGAVWGTQSALRRMQPRDRGTIVLVGSALAYRGIPLLTLHPQGWRTAPARLLGQVAGVLRRQGQPLVSLFHGCFRHLLLPVERKRRAASMAR